MSMSLLTNLQDESVPLFASCRTETNTQHDFVQLVIDAVNHGHLVAGDFLICDNARVHTGGETLTTLQTYLESVGVTLRLLPAYSPELNPCENRSEERRVGKECVITCRSR